MKQPVKKTIKTKLSKKKIGTKKSERNLDGSGLETFFRENILEKLGIRYQQQFEAKSIGRFYDFYLPDFRVIIECDGFFFTRTRDFTRMDLCMQRRRGIRGLMNIKINGLLLMDTCY